MHKNDPRFEQNETEIETIATIKTKIQQCWATCSKTTDVIDQLNTHFQHKHNRTCQNYVVSEIEKIKKAKFNATSFSCYKY